MSCEAQAIGVAERAMQRAPGTEPLRPADHLRLYFPAMKLRGL
jgi:hypothetical protein